MINTKEKMQIAIEWIKKYRIILSSMLITAVVILCAIVSFVYNKDAKRFEIAAKQIEGLSQNIVKHYKASPSYWGLSSREVINNKLYTADIIVAGNRLIGNLGNIIEIGSDENGTMVMPSAKSFVIAYRNLTKKDCEGLGSQKFNKSFWLNVNKITIKNNLKSQDFSWGDKNYELPVKHKILKDLCQKEANSIIIHF